MLTQPIVALYPCRSVLRGNERPHRRKYGWQAVELVERCFDGRSGYVAIPSRLATTDLLDLVRQPSVVKGNRLLWNRGCEYRVSRRSDEYEAILGAIGAGRQGALHEHGPASVDHQLGHRVE